MMLNFSIFALATIASTANAINLRASVTPSPNNKDNSKQTKEARLIIHGLSNDASDQDLNLIQKSINNAFAGALFVQDGILSTALAEDTASAVADPACNLCPHDDDAALAVERENQDKQAEFVMFNFVHGVSDPACNLCPPDDDAMVEIFDNHKAVEKKVCNHLRSSGSANLINAHGCQLSFL
jgi:hypothetical protein